MRGISEYADRLLYPDQNGKHPYRSTDTEGSNWTDHLGSVHDVSQLLAPLIAAVGLTAIN